MTDNILSIDLESFVYINAEKKGQSEKRKKKDNGHIIKATNCLLQMLKNSNTKATFFIVAEIYDWYPNLIEKIKKEGHEICLHTYSHKKILRKEVLRKEMKKSLKFIRHFKPKGFRAPEAYLKRDYFKILKEYGFTYDSSSYDMFKNMQKISGVLEMPISTYCFRRQKKGRKFPKNLSFSLLKTDLPIGSGYFIGILGKKISLFIERLNKKNCPYVMFIHPWQIEKPPEKIMDIIKIIITKPTFFPYFINQKKTFKHLLEKYNFTTFWAYIEDNNLI